MWLMLTIWLASSAVTVFGTWYALKQFQRTPPHLDAPFGLFPVSILKPLKGIDPGTPENLLSFFRLDYPDFELIFSVGDPHDPVCKMVENLMRRHPHVRARLIRGSRELGPNPKVNNLARSYESAAYDLILISDSNVRVERDYLKRMVAHLDNGVGMVTSVVAGCNPESFGGLLEATYLNTFYARGMQLTGAIGRPAVVGKSMLFRRSVASRFGGIPALSRYLAEDYMAGVAMEKLGLQTVIACDPIHQQIGDYSVSDFWNRHLRWGRIRKSQAPVTFAIEPLFGCLISSLLGAVSASSLFGIAPASFILSHWLVWSACDFLLLSRLGGRVGVGSVLAWFTREMSAPILWMHIASGRTVIWRGQKLAIQSGGLLDTTATPAHATERA